MGEKKLWVVTVETEAVVLAETREEAERFASEIKDDLLDVQAEPMTYVPAGWDADCLVYHDGKEDLRLGDLPEFERFRERCEELKRKADRVWAGLMEKAKNPG